MTFTAEEVQQIADAAWDGVLTGATLTGDEARIIADVTRAVD